MRSELSYRCSHCLGVMTSQRSRGHLEAHRIYDSVRQDESFEINLAINENQAYLLKNCMRYLWLKTNIVFFFFSFFFCACKGKKENIFWKLGFSPSPLSISFTFSTVLQALLCQSDFGVGVARRLDNVNKNLM